MGRNAEVTLQWADGEHVFRLAVGQIRDLQEKCDAGPAWIAKRLMDRTWRVDDIREPIRLGLIGGGMVPSEALKLVGTYVDDRPLLENVPVAISIIMAVLLPVEDDPIPKSAAAEDDSSRPFAESFPSPPSTATARPSASTQQKPTS